MTVWALITGLLHRKIGSINECAPPFEILNSYTGEKYPISSSTSLHQQGKQLSSIPTRVSGNVFDSGMEIMLVLCVYPGGRGERFTVPFHS